MRWSRLFFVGTWLLIFVGCSTLKSLNPLNLLKKNKSKNPPEETYAPQADLQTPPSSSAPEQKQDLSPLFRRRGESLSTASPAPDSTPPEENSSSSPSYSSSNDPRVQELLERVEQAEQEVRRMRARLASEKSGPSALGGKGTSQNTAPLSAEDVVSEQSRLIQHVEEMLKSFQDEQDKITTQIPQLEAKGKALQKKQKEFEALLKTLQKAPSIETSPSPQSH